MPATIAQTLSYAKPLIDRHIVGVDEAGRGPLAGPVVAAAVVLCKPRPGGLDDSKKLKPARPKPPPSMDTPQKLQKVIDTQIDRAVAAVAKLRARGVQVLFVRPPSIGPYYAFEQHVFPRATTWDVLLRRTGAPGIHFEDYPQLQGYDQPEWSHLSAAEANRFTAALVPIIQRDYWRKPGPLVGVTTPVVGEVKPTAR